MKIKSCFSKIFVLMLCCLMALTACGKAKDKDTSSAPVTSSDDLFQTDNTGSDDSQSSSDDSNVSSDTNSGNNNPSNNQGNNSGVSSNVADAMQGQIDLKGKTLTMLIPSADKELQTRFKNFCNGNIKFITAAYSDMKNVLAQKVMSNQAPDIYFMTNQDYPTVIYQDLLQPLDGMIDFNTELWSGAKATLAQFKWTDGKTYFIGEYELGNMFMWNKKVFADAGITETPATLMAKNQWNWDTFLELAKRVADVDNGRYGFGTESNFCFAALASAGEDIVYMDSKNGLVNNVNSANVAKAMDFMQKAYDTKTTFPGDGYPLFSKGQMAMFYGWWGHGTDKNFVNQCNAGNYAFAMFPKMPGMSGNQYSLSGTTTGYAIPRGAKNVDAAIAFLIMNRVDTAYKNELIEKQIKNNSLQKTNFKEMYNMYYQQKFVPIVSLGVSQVTAAFLPVESKVRGGTPWSSLKPQLSPNIDQAIKSIKR